jgi:hypothetical protein
MKKTRSQEYVYDDEDWDEDEEEEEEDNETSSDDSTPRKRKFDMPLTFITSSLFQFSLPFFAGKEKLKKSTNQSVPVKRKKRAKKKKMPLPPHRHPSVASRMALPIIAHENPTNPTLTIPHRTHTNPPLPRPQKNRLTTPLSLSLCALPLTRKKPHLSRSFTLMKLTFPAILSPTNVSLERMGRKLFVSLSLPHRIRLPRSHSSNSSTVSLASNSLSRLLLLANFPSPPPRRRQKLSNSLPLSLSGFLYSTFWISWKSLDLTSCYRLLT